MTLKNVHRPTLTPVRWKRAGEIFDDLLDLPPEQRDAHLSAACSGDNELEQEVRRLLELDARAGSYLETPLFNLAEIDEEPRLRAGEVVAGRFEIVALLGRGGMGEVYEARDRELRETVALKVMRPAGADARGMAERFRREVQLARRISHPSVCRVHDVASHRDADGGTSVVLTMELVRGDTLAQRLRSAGPMAPAAAIAIATQLASALDAAHASDIVHRDIKPGNIILQPLTDGGARAVLTDFGLATAPRGPDEGPTPASLVFGTPEYLAPEQLRGEPPTKASDRYALALVIYELLTGVRPHADNLLARASAPPAAPSTVRPELGTAWDAMFARALAPEPAERFGTAVEMVDAAAAAMAAPRVPTRQSLTGVRRRLVGAAAAILALGVALAAAGFRFMDRTTPGIAPASQVLLNHVFNGTGDADLDGVTEVLRSQLAQSTRFEMLPRERVSSVLAQMQRDDTALSDPLVAREVALREGVSTVVFGSLSRLSSDYVLSVRIERVGARPSTVAGSWSKDFISTSKGQIFSAVNDAAVWVRSTVGETADRIAEQNRPPADTTTTSWEALRLFVRANEEIARGRSAEATLLLEESLRFDPAFASAQTRLGDVLLSLRREREAYGAWQKAVQLVDQRQLTTRESERIRSQYLEDTGDLPSAEKAYRTYLLHYPDDFRANVYLGSVLVDLGRSSEAVEFFKRAADVRPSDWVPSFHLARVFLDLKRDGEAMEAIARLRAFGRAEYADWLTGVRAFARGDVGAALSAVEALADSPDAQWVSRAFVVRSSWEAERGQEPRARRELLDGIEFDQRHGFRDREADKWLFLADLQCRANDPSACSDAASRAVSLSNNVYRVVKAGTLSARMGRLADAERFAQMLDDQPDIPKIRAARLRLQGEIALTRADYAEGTRLLRDAFGLAPERQERSYLARAEALSGNPESGRRLLGDYLAHPVWAYFNPEPEAIGIWSVVSSIYEGTAAAPGRPTH